LSSSSSRGDGINDNRIFGSGFTSIVFGLVPLWVLGISSAGNPESKSFLMLLDLLLPPSVPGDGGVRPITGVEGRMRSFRIMSSNDTNPD
jgi:hypothetical protein